MAAALTLSGPVFNPLARVWAAYERSLRRRPMLTQAVSSALLWGLGDAMAQRIETRGRGGIDSRRVALTAAFGGAVIGPAGHAWYQLLERMVLQLGLACSMKSMLLKVTVDNLLYSPCYVLAFFAYGCMAIDGLSPAEFAAKMREEFVPTMLAEAMLWPPYMCAVFSRVPVKHQLMAVNVASLLDVCFLSWMRTKDAADPEGQVQQQLQLQQQQQQQKVKELKAAIAEPQQRRARSQARGGAAEAAARKAATALESSQRLQQEEEEEFGVAPSRDAAVAALWPWVASPDENVGRMAFMAASATCSSAGGGGLLGLRPAAMPAATGAAGAAGAASAPPSARF